MEISYLADWNEIIQDYSRNRSLLANRGALRYEKKYLDRNIVRIKKFLLMSKELTQPSVFPEFLETLDKVKAPKTCLNVANVIIDFCTFLKGKFGSDGMGRLVKPESVIITINDYKTTLHRPAREWKQTQQMLDFGSLPSFEEVKDVKSKIWNLAERLLSRGESRGHLVEREYNLLMESLIGLLIMRNCKRPSPCRLIKFEHWVQACEVPGTGVFILAMMPAEELVEEVLDFFGDLIENMKH